MNNFVTQLYFAACCRASILCVGSANVSSCMQSICQLTMLPMHIFQLDSCLNHIRKANSRAI